MTEEIKYELKGLEEDLPEAEITDDIRKKTVVLRVKDSTDAKDENEERDRSVVFNAYNLALHSEFFRRLLGREFPCEAESAGDCLENIDFSAIPDDPYSDERSIITLSAPVTLDSLKFLAEFVNTTEPVEPVGINFKWFPPSAYMEIIYRRYDTIPELMKYLVVAVFLGFRSLTHFLASEVAEQLRMYTRDKEQLTRADIEAFMRGEVWTPNHDTRRRRLMLASVPLVSYAAREEMREFEGKRA